MGREGWAGGKTLQSEAPDMSSREKNYNSNPLLHSKNVETNSLLTWKIANARGRAAEEYGNMTDCTGSSLNYSKQCHLLGPAQDEASPKDLVGVFTSST